MELIKLKGATKPYIWGGDRLFKYGKTSNDEIIAESWELSFHKDGPTLIDSGINKGKLLSEVAKAEDFGTDFKNFDGFPILNKLIDAKNNLSIQVHPSDDYALKYENSLGKTEMWYVVDAAPGAQLHIGLNKDVTKEEFVDAIKNNTLLDIMNHIDIKKGDCYFIPSGTLHAIGAGALVYEIQENSNITYRVYDYGRVGKDGKPRELHIDKAVQVTSFKKFEPKNLQDEVLADCKYFKVSKFNDLTKIRANSDSFVALTFLEGKGKIGELNYSKGDTFFVPANTEYKITGNNLVIKTTI